MHVYIVYKVTTKYCRCNNYKAKSNFKLSLIAKELPSVELLLANATHFHLKVLSFRTIFEMYKYPTTWLVVSLRRVLLALSCIDPGQDPGPP